MGYVSPKQGDETQKENMWELGRQVISRRRGRDDGEGQMLVNICATGLESN